MIPSNRSARARLALAALGAAVALGGCASAPADSCGREPAAAAPGDFPARLSVAGHALKLNGVGLRLFSFLNVKVYAGALYLETPSHDADAIVQDPGFKHVELRFLRGVSASKISDAWAEGFDRNCAEDCAAMKPGIARLQSLTPDMKEGGTLAFDFGEGGVAVSVDGKRAGSVEGAAFERNLLRLWLGKKPPNSELKQGMLGG